MFRTALENPAPTLVVTHIYVAYMLFMFKVYLCCLDTTLEEDRKGERDDNNSSSVSPLWISNVTARDRITGGVRST